MKPTIQNIFSDMHSFRKIDPLHLNKKQNKAVNDILTCRTKEKGYHTDECENCHDISIFYNSCKNPCCPQCQAVNKEVWAMKQEFYKLNIHYFHIVFTIPSELNSLCLLRPALMYNILFESASQTLKQLSEDEKYLGAQIGFTGVLHTWGANLSLHPHIHFIVSGGGIDKNGNWISSTKKFFLPVKVVSSLFRGKFMSKLKERFSPAWLNSPEEFSQLVDQCYSKEWNVYTKKTMNDPSAVIHYLSRYTHRIAISNARIVSYENHKVTFSYKDYKDHSKIKYMTLSEEEFFRRYMMHVPPERFMRIRHYGFLSNSHKTDRFIKLRSITNTPVPKEKIFKPDMVSVISRIIKRDASICSCCGQRRHPLRN